MALATTGSAVGALAVAPSCLWPEEVFTTGEDVTTFGNVAAFDLDV